MIAGVVKEFLESMAVGEPLLYEGLAVFPLTAERESALEHLILEEALDAEGFQITEASESGSVPELLAVNGTDSAVLLVDGEELVGAKQNRILNVSVLVGAGTTVRIPVSCVEEGRWEYKSHDFKAGMYAPAFLRAKTSHEAGRTRNARADQSRVWNDVACFLRNNKIMSFTGAMNDLYESRGADFEAYEKALPLPDEARGFVAVIDGRIAGCDVFARPDALRRKWPRLVRALAAEAQESRDRAARPGAERVSAFLKDAASAAAEPIQTPGLGQVLHLKGQRVIGNALVHEDALVHVSLFEHE